MAKLKLPIALDKNTGELIHINNITKNNKDTYEFICPECKTILIPKMGDVNAHHFAHKNADCNINGETIIHMMAKKVIAENNEIVVPIYNPVTLRWQHIKHTYKLVDVEKKYDDIIPDVIIEVEGRLVFIEVAYTHFIDEDKHEKLKRIGIETWEIDLRDFDLFDIDEINELGNELLYETYNKSNFVIDITNYNIFLHNECIRFKNQDRILYSNPYFCDLSALCEDLSMQYQNIQTKTFLPSKDVPMLEDGNIMRVFDTQTNLEYWIRVMRIGKSKYYYIFLYINGQCIELSYSSTMMLERLDIPNLTHYVAELLTDREVNLHSNRQKQNENNPYMLFSAIPYIKPRRKKKK